MRQIKLINLARLVTMDSKINIYVLELEGGKWYVGKTTNLESRLDAHMSGMGSEWTKLHKPLKMEHSFIGDKFDEDKTTKQYMEKYGIDNVRGGAYVLPKLTKEQKKLLSLELNMAADKCLKCGKTGHFSKQCKAMLSTRKSIPASGTQNTLCVRCGRKSHSIEDCYAKKDIDDYELLPPGSEHDCDRCHDTVFRKDGCDCMLCTRCGRNNHNADKCYAKSHILGNKLQITESEPDAKTTNLAMNVLSTFADGIRDLAHQVATQPTAKQSEATRNEAKCIIS